VAKAAAFVATLGGKLRLYFLPPYPPDRNPGALVWKHLEAAGRMAITGKDDIHRKVRSSIRQRQNDSEKIRAFDRKPSLKYAASICSNLWTD
jgi:transposase